jgi:hypothetical protein
MIERGILSQYSAEQAARIKSAVTNASLLTSLPSPLTLIIRSLLIGYVLWIGALFSNISVPIKPFFALVACAQITVLLHKTVLLMVQRMIGMPLKDGFEIGLNLLLPRNWLAQPGKVCRSGLLQLT